MLKIDQQERLTMTQVAKRLDVHVSTVWRWASARGVGGTRLRTYRIGGRKVVLTKDLEAFLAELNADAEQALTADAPDARRCNIAAAEARLQSAGIL